MGLPIPMGRALLGFGLAAAVLFGCERFVEEEGGTGTEEGAPEDLALQLAVKATRECRDQRDAILAARLAGKATEKAEKAFLAGCVEELEPRSDGKALVLPRDLELDERSRCRWMVTQIDGGRDELTVKFRYYCPDDCDTLAAADSARHVKYCRDPRPDCEQLTRKLSRLDSNSTEYGRLLRYLRETCWGGPVKPPRTDTLGSCDSLRLGLIRIDTTRPGGDSLLLALRRRCGLVPPPITPCDSLRRVMAVTLYTAEGWERVNRQLQQLCGGGGDTACVPPALPPRGICDSLYREWTRLEPSSPAYAPAKARYHSVCVDSLLPRDFCDDLRTNMSLADTASREYAGLREVFYQRCVRIVVD